MAQYMDSGAFHMRDLMEFLELASNATSQASTNTIDCTLNSCTYSLFVLNVQ